jgi:hypothetical protein
MTYPRRAEQEFLFKYTSDGDVEFSNFDIEHHRFGFLNMINVETEFVYIFFEAEHQAAQLLLTMNCGEPDISYFPS